MKKYQGLLTPVFVLGLWLSAVAQQPVSSRDKQLTDQEMRQLSFKGRTLTVQEVSRAETSIASDPFDITNRILLIGYYGAQFDKELRAKKCDHVLWSIENIPSSHLFHYLVETRLYKSIDQCFEAGKDLWLKAIESHNGSLDVLSNAAEYFLISEKELAERLLKEGAAKDQTNPEWSRRLGNLYSLQMNNASGEARKTLATSANEQFETALKLCNDRIGQRLIRLEIARTAFEAGATERARTVATELLGEVQNDSSPMNSADLVHGAHNVIGRVALRTGDLSEAKHQLLEAAKVNGSPVLNSFGPGMKLAQELLEQGQRDVVLEYLVACSSFWKDKRLQEWTATLKSGGSPDFGANLSR